MPFPLVLLAALLVVLLPLTLAGHHLSRNKLLLFSALLFISLAVLVHLLPYLPYFFFPSSSLLPSPNPCHASLLLNDSRILISGDSQARLFTLALISSLMTPTDAIRSDLFKRHSDYSFVVPDKSVSIDFVWAPFEANSTEVLRRLRRGGGRSPDVVVVGSGLWHMLHSGDVRDYGAELRKLKEAVEGLEASKLFWLGMPVLVERMLNTEEKRERMRREVWEGYDREVRRSGVLEVFRLIDVGFLSRRCGVGCTEDGMHYAAVVYEAAVQLMLSAMSGQLERRI